MAIVLRSVKGSNLTPAEVDGNFTDLDGRVTALEENPPEPNEISNILVVGTQMTIVLEDSTEFGPFTLPQANFRPSVVAAIDPDTDGSWTPALADANGYKRHTGAGGLTVVVPSNAEVAFVTDTEISLYQGGAGAITIDWPTDVTVNVPTGFLPQTAQRCALITLKKVGADEWDLVGWLAADVTA